MDKNYDHHNHLVNKVLVQTAQATSDAHTFPKEAADTGSDNHGQLKLLQKVFYQLMLMYKIIIIEIPIKIARGIFLPG